MASLHLFLGVLVLSLVGASPGGSCSSQAIVPIFVDRVREVMTELNPGGKELFSTKTKEATFIYLFFSAAVGIRARSKGSSYVIGR